MAGGQHKFIYKKRRDRIWLTDGGLRSPRPKEYLGSDPESKQQIRSECGSPYLAGSRERERTEPGVQRTGFQPCVQAVQLLPIPNTSLSLSGFTVHTRIKMEAPPQLMGRV